MQSLLRRVPALVSLPLLCALGSCAAFEQPAALPLVATFRVNATLVSNGCGFGGLPLPGAQELDATLRGFAGDPAEWRWEGQTAVAGTSSSTGVYVFSGDTQYELAPADPFLDYPGCMVRRHDEITLTVTPTPIEVTDAGTSDAATDAGDGGASDGGTSGYTVSGQLMTDVVPLAGSDCSPMLGANGGSWLALPCQARMTLSGASL